MKKLSLRIRLLLLFTGISCLIWICSGLFSWFESREKIDEFFDQYQILLASQLASADWSGLSADSQKATNRIIGGPPCLSLSSRRGKCRRRRRSDRFCRF